MAEVKVLKVRKLLTVVDEKGKAESRMKFYDDSKKKVTEVKVKGMMIVVSLLMS